MCHNITFTIHKIFETAFAPLAIDIDAAPPENTYTDLTAGAESARFYQIELE